jgi:diaminopimelate decarboxylase
VLQLCNDFGTPLYAYDANKIQSQYQKLKNAFAGVDMEVKYAVKALSNISVLKLFRNLGAGLDVVSIQEAMLGLKAGFLLLTNFIYT